jgi:sulfur relay (sulfurtransferase) complex TusBCD TusD component (DsrE family)
MSPGARLFQAEAGSWWLHDPDVGLLARIVPIEETDRKLRSQSAERPISVLYRMGERHAAYREVVQDLRRAAVALLRKIEEKTGRVFLPRDVVINEALSQKSNRVSLQELLDLQASPLAKLVSLEVEVYACERKTERERGVQRVYIGYEMSVFHGLLQETQVATHKVGDVWEQAWVWLDRTDPRDSLLKAYPFVVPINVRTREYARNAVISIAEDLGFLEASGFLGAMRWWLEDQPPMPLEGNQSPKHFGVGFGYPADAQGGDWTRIVVYYHNTESILLGFWPALGRHESLDDLRRYGLLSMAPL